MLEIELSQALVNSSVFDSVRAAFSIIVPTGIYTYHVLMNRAGNSVRKFVSSTVDVHIVKY